MGKNQEKIIINSIIAVASMNKDLWYEANDVDYYNNGSRDTLLSEIKNYIEYTYGDLDTVLSLYNTCWITYEDLIYDVWANNYFMIDDIIFNI